MKIAVVGASGRVGRLLVEEAMSRGHEVTAIVRNPDKAPRATKVVVKDLFDLTYDDIKDCEVIIDAFGTWTPDTLDQHSTSLRHLCNILSGKPNRLIVVGGAGSLYVNPEHTTQLMDTEDFPPEFKPVASSMAKALAELRTRNDVNWTYISPAADFQVDGPRTGKYILGGEELILNSKGESVISYADYAVAVIDEAERGRYIGQRISVVGEYD